MTIRPPRPRYPRPPREEDEGDEERVVFARLGLVSSVVIFEITGGNRRKIIKLMIKVKQRMNRKRSSFVEHPRKELTLAPIH
jgi:hypothetical protein